MEFGQAKVEAEFFNIQVNTDKQLIGGHVESTLNPAGPFIVGLDSDPELDNTEEAADTETPTPPTDVTIGGVVTDVDVNEDDGTITVTNEDGTTTTIDPNEEGVDENGDGDIVIEDSNGDTWVVGPDGTVTQPAPDSNNDDPSNNNGNDSDSNTNTNTVLISYLSSDYENNNEIVLSTESNEHSFTLKNHAVDDVINWTVSHGEEDVTAIVFGQNATDLENADLTIGEEYGTLILKATYGDKDISVTLKNGSNTDGGTEEGETEEVKIWFALDNKEYANGETLTLDFTSNENNLAFELRNYPESTTTFKWSFMHNGTDHTVDVQNNERNLYNFGFDIGGKAGDIRLIAEYDGTPIEIIINVVRKEFELKSIMAIDGNNENRMAHWGETLYLVNGSVDLGGLTASERDINYQAKITPDLDFNEFSSGDLAWSYENQETTNLEQEFGVKTITRTVEEEEDIIRTTVKAGHPSEDEKEMYVDVKWVDGKKRSYSFVPPALSTVLTKKMQDVDGNLKVLDQVFKLAGINFKVDPIKISGYKYNAEDKYSRLYRQYEVGKVAGGVSAEIPEKVIPFPPLAFLSRAGIVDVGLFFKADLKFFIEGGVERYSLVESTETIGTNPFITGGCKGCMETGIIAKLLVAEHLVNFEVKGSATGCLVGQVKFSLEDYSYDGKVYIPPVIIAGKVKISTKGTLNFTLVNFEKSMTITDQLIIYD